MQNGNSTPWDQWLPTFEIAMKVQNVPKRNWSKMAILNLALRSKSGPIRRHGQSDLGQILSGYVHILSVDIPLHHVQHPGVSYTGKVNQGESSGYRTRMQEGILDVSDRKPEVG